ncbi:MAG: hypothetical protein J7M26_03785 [Armatimonadetes bacterium]|nr:hypothetical protein [Armatimonadota bacterium]
MKLATRAVVVAAALTLVAFSWGFTNLYEPRGMHFAGRSDEGLIQFSWTGAKFRPAQSLEGARFEAELRLKVWGKEGQRGQVFLCLDLRPVAPHPELPACRDKQARLMPLYCLYDGVLQPRRAHHHERQKFTFRVNIPLSYRMYDLRLVALRAPNAEEAIRIIRENLTVQDLRDHGKELGLTATPDCAGKDVWQVKNVARLYALDPANMRTLPYWQRYPGYPLLFQPLLPPRAEVK